VAYQSAHDRFLNPKNLAVQVSAAENRTNDFDADVLFTLHGSHFVGDSKFFQGFPEVPMPDGVTLRDIEAIYDAFQAPQVGAPAIDYSQLVTVNQESQAPEDVVPTATPNQLSAESMRTPAENPTLAVKASIYKVRFANGRLPHFADGPQGRWLAPQFRIYELMETTLGPEDDYDRYYRQCLVHVVNTSFASCSAPGGRDALGGAVYMRQSQLLVHWSNFTDCRAGFGGALALLGASVVVQLPRFSRCLADYEAGAVALSWRQAVDLWSGEGFAQFVSCSFVRCTAREVAGAVSIQGYLEAAMDRCNFTGCQSGAMGGALSAMNSNLLVFRTHFVGNRCGVRSEDTLKGFDAQFEEGPVLAIRERHPLSGGGALRFAVQVDGLFQLGTEESCFVGNEVVGERSLHSFDIYVAGNSSYQSYGDRFLNLRANSIEAEENTSIRTYRTRFYGASGFFRDGHTCDVAEYEAAYAEYAGTVVPIVESIVYTPARTSAVGGVPEQSALPANTPWATRIPIATPAGYVAPTFYTPHTSLPAQDYSLHSPATPSDAFVATGAHKSAAFPPTGTWTSTGLFTGLGPTDLLMSLAFIRSRSLPANSSVGSTEPPAVRTRTVSASPLPLRTPMMTSPMTASAVPPDLTYVDTETFTMTLVTITRAPSAVTVIQSRAESLFITTNSWSLTEVQVHEELSYSWLIDHNFTVWMIAVVYSVTQVYTIIEVPIYETTRVTFRHLVDIPMPGEKKGITNTALIGICTGAALFIALFFGALRLILRFRPSEVESDSSNLTEVSVTGTLAGPSLTVPKEFNADVVLGGEDEKRFDAREFGQSDDDVKTADGPEEDIYV
jgi:hypothetical protein